MTSSADAPTATITDDRDELVAFFDYPGGDVIKGPAAVLPGPCDGIQAHRIGTVPVDLPIMS